MYVRRNANRVWRSLLTTLGVLSTVAAATVSPASGQQRGTTEPTQSDRFHFREPIFRFEYLQRAAEAAQRRDALEDAPNAARYAKRYGISRDLAKTIIEAATAEGIDPELAFRLVHTESRFHPRARGPAGALGLVQLMPSTARALDRSLRTEEQILDPQTNLRLGFGYLRRLITMFDGDVRLGLLAYNRGEGTVSRALRRGRNPENGYSRKVLGSRDAGPYEGRGILPER